MANARVAERMAAQRKQYEEEEDKLQKQAVKQKAAAASASEKAFAQKEEAKQKAAERKAADLPSAADSSAKTSAKANSYTKTQQAQTAFETWQRDAEERRRAQQEEAKRKAAERKEADLPSYKPSGGLDTEEVKRLYNLDTEAEEERLSELKAKNIAEGGTVAAVNRGIRAGRTGTVDVDFSEAEEGRKQAEDLERDILLAKEIQRQAEWIKAQDSSEKMAEGREGYAAWEAMKAKQKAKGPGVFEQAVNVAWNTPDMTNPAGLFQQAVNVHREDTSENEPNDDWTYEQKRTFGYYWGRGEYQKAAEYAREINNAIRGGQKQEAIDEITQILLGSDASKFAADLASVPASILGGVGYLDKLAQQAAQGYYAETSLPVIEDLKNAYRSARAEQINREHGTLGEEWGELSGKGFGDLYNIGMGAADSMFAAYAGGKSGALISAFGSSAAGATDDALARGADLQTALGYGTVVGAAELFPEYLSIDNLFRLGSAKSLGGFLKNVGSQAASEGMEGAVTAISGALADDVIMGELSKFNTEVNAYMMDGYSREEAEQMAAKGGRIDIILDAVSEAIGGGMSGAAVTGVNSAFGRNTLSEETPVPFNGNAVTEEQKLVADKIAEIENRPVSEAEKAELMEAVLEVAQEENGSAEVIAEVEKFKNIHGQNAEIENIEKQSRGGNFIPAIKAHIKEIIQMPPVASVTKNLFSKDKGKLTETVWNYFESIGGRVNREGFGEVILAKSGIKKSVISGMSEEKAKAFEVVPEVIKKGRQIDFQHNFKNRGYDTYTFAAPYDTENGKRIVGVIVKKDNNNQRYYLHEVVDENGDIIYKNKETSDDTSKSGSGYNSQITGVSSKVSNNIISPDSEIGNPSGIENENIFGPKIIGEIMGLEPETQEASSDNEGGAMTYEEYSALEDTVPSFVRADIDRVINDPSIDDEQKFVELAALYDRSATPAEKAEIGRQIYLLRSGKAKPAFNENEAERVSAEVAESAKRVAQHVAERIKAKREQAAETSGKAEETPAETEEGGELVEVAQSDKSRRYERRVLRRVEEGIASVFGIERADLKGDIRPLVEKAAADIKDGKKISDETIDQIYKKAFEDGLITEEFPQYESTRRLIRHTPIFVDKKTQNEFGDTYAFRDFASENFGSMKISSNPRDSHLDSFYKTLCEVEPSMFHEGETDPKTQLEDIADFMQQTKKQYYGLSEVYSGENLADFEKWAKRELRSYMDEFGRGIDNVRMYERDRQIKATNKAREIDREASFDQAKAAFEGGKIFEAKRTMENVKAKHLLNDMDLLVVKRLHEGTITEGDVIFQNASNVEGIIEVYEAEKAYRQARAPFDRYRIAYKTALKHDAIELTKQSDEFSDKKLGIEYSRETAERNIRDITKNGRFGGEAIISEYIRPIHEHEAEKIRWLRELGERVKGLELGRMNRYERAYAQMIGENFKYISEGKVTKHNEAEHEALNERIEDILHNHGDKIDKAKCEKAAAGFMDIYKDILEQWNDERIRRGQEPVGEIEGYFPHFEEAKPENTIQKIFSLFGFEIGSSKLPTDIAGRTADRKPQSKYNPFANRRTTDVTDYDILKGFDLYTRAVGDNIFHTEDIQKLRALSDTIRTKYSSASTEARVEEIRNRNDLSEEDKDVLIADVFKEAPGKYHLSNFVVWLDEYTNILAGKKSRGDREAEYQMGREIYDISKALEGRIASNMIGFNISTPIMNLVPLFQATADLSPVEIVSSIVQTGIAAARGDSYVSDMSDFITNRFGADSVYKKNFGLFTAENAQDFVSKVSDGGGFLMELVDRIVSDSLVRARAQQNMRKGENADVAFAEADEWAAGLIADRSLGALPTIFNVKNPVAKALTMFQVEANNQYSYILKDAGKYKWDNKGAVSTVMGQVAFWLAMALCNDLAKELLGRDNVVPDPIGMTADALEKIKNGEQTGEVIYDAATSAVEQLPFVGGLLGGGRIPLSSALPDAEQAAKLLNPEVSGEKKGQILLDEILKPLSYLILPSGGGQLWKTGKGIGQLIEGGAYGTEADGDRYLKFAQEYDPESIIKTVLFGQYASDAGQEYIDSGFSQKLSAKQTEQMEKAEALGMENGEFFDIIMGLKPYDTKEEKQKALLDMDIPVEDKNIIDAILFGGMTYKDIEGGRSVTERDYRGVEEFIVSGLDRKERILWDEDFSERDIERGMKALKDANTKEEKIEGLSAALKVEEDEAFRLIQKMEGNWIEDEKGLSEEEKARAEGAAKLYDMSTEDFITVLNYSKYGAQIVNEKGETEWSTKDEHVIPNVMRVTGWDEETAKKNLDIAKKYEFSRADLEEEKAVQLDTSAEWYGVEDDKFFVARNVLKTVEGEKDEYGKTVSGTYKKAAINAIREKLGVDESEATIYYLAASGYLILSEDDMETSQIEKMKKAVEGGYWTERQYMDAMNIIKVTGADSRAEITEALMAAGATREMANAYCDIKWSKSGSSGSSGGKSYSYGMRNEKQVTKGDYFIENYGNGEVTGKEISAWYAAASGCSKKQEYIDAYMSAGATFDQATKFYNLMRGYDRTFNAWYKENGG